MLIKRKLYSVIDEEGNLGYYLYNEATGEEKLFSVVEEEEREFSSVRRSKKALKVAADIIRRDGGLNKRSVQESVNNSLKKLAKRSDKEGISAFNKVIKGQRYQLDSGNRKIFGYKPIKSLENTSAREPYKRSVDNYVHTIKDLYKSL